MLGCRRDETSEILERAELGMDRIMAAGFRTDRVGASGIVLLGLETVVPALAMGFADRVDGRQVEDIEAHVPDRRKPGDHVVERAVAMDIPALRTGEQLVPARETCARPLRIERERLRADQERPPVRFRHGRRGLGVKEYLEPRFVIGRCEPVGDPADPVGDVALSFGSSRLDEETPLLQFESDIEPCLMLLLQLEAEDGERVPPDLHGEFVPADPLQGKFTRPTVVDHGRHRRFVPLGLVGAAPEKSRLERIMAVAENIRFDPDHVAGDALDRKAAPVDDRRDGLDHQTRASRRLLDRLDRRRAPDRVQGMSLENLDLARTKPHEGGRIDLATAHADRMEGNEPGAALREKKRACGLSASAKIGVHQCEARHPTVPHVVGIDPQDRCDRSCMADHEVQGLARETAVVAGQEPVGRLDLSGQVEDPRPSHSGKAGAIASRRIEPLATPELEAHRHEQTISEGSGEPQGPNSPAFQHLPGLDLVGEALLEGSFRAGDLVADRPVHIVLIGKPAIPQVPPGQR